MQLCAILTKVDLESLIDQLTPLRVALHPRRVINLGRPSKVELVAGYGLRLRGAARFTWDALGVSIPVTVSSWQILLVPAFFSRGAGHVLAFEPVLEELDFKRVPMLLEGRIADAVKASLTAQQSKLVWDFEKDLSLVHALPEKLTPAGELLLGPSGGNVTVTSSEVRLTLDFALTIRREAPPASLRAEGLQAAAR